MPTALFNEMLIQVLVYKWADSFVVTSPICEVMQSKVAVSRQTAVKDGTHHGARLPSVCIYNCLFAIPAHVSSPEGPRYKSKEMWGAKGQNMNISQHT